MTSPFVGAFSRFASIRFSKLAFAGLAALCTTAVAQEAPPSNALFLKEPISITHDSGITSFIPGTQVTQVGQTKEGVKIKTAEGLTTVVKPSQVTGDKAEGQRLADLELQRQGAAQAQMAQAIEQQRLAAHRNAELLNQSAAQSARASSASVAAAPPTTTTSGPGLQRTAIKYEAEEANVTVKPPTFKKKKKK